jgi:hypothetical protein
LFLLFLFEEKKRLMITKPIDWRTQSID